MDVWGVTVAAFRRWYVLFPLLFVSIAAAYFVGSRAQAEYEVTGSVVLVARAQDLARPNPYAGDSAAEILGLKAMSSATRAEFLEEGLSTEYEVLFDRRSPLMGISVVADSEDIALATSDGILDLLEAILDESQRELDVAPENRVTLGTVDALDSVEPVLGGTMRVTAVVGVMGVIMSVAIAVAVDGALARRRHDSLTRTSQVSPDESGPGSGKAERPTSAQNEI